MNRVRFLCKLIESHHFCLYLRHIWLLLTSLLYCQTWKCKYSVDRKNKFTSKILFFLTLRATWWPPVLRIWSQVLHEGIHPKSSQKEKSCQRAKPKKIYPLFILRKGMAKVEKKSLWRLQLLKHNFLGFKLNCFSREIRHWPTLSFCNFICDRSKRYYNNFYTLQKYYYIWKCKLVGEMYLRLEGKKR